MGIFNPKKVFGPDAVIQQRDNLLFNRVDDEIVLLSIENNEYLGMDKIGSFIWLLIERPITLRSLIQKLLEKYNVPENQCLNDTEDFLKALYIKNLISVS